MKINAYIILLSLLILSSCNKEKVTSIDLSGEWRFRIDSLDRGITEKWYTNLPDEVVQLPGSMTTNGRGNEVTVNTQWTGSIVDSSWYFDEKYARYRVPGNIKIPESPSKVRSPGLIVFEYVHFGQRK